MIDELIASRLPESLHDDTTSRWLADLPPLPHVAAEALGLIDDPDVSAIRLARLLQKDPALAARVLKISNSAAFASLKSITTLNQAIMVLGLKTLKGVIVAATLRQLQRGSHQVEQIIWENSTFTALASRLLAQRTSFIQLEEVFLDGLLHDLGKLVLLHQPEVDYESVITEVRESGEDFASVENRILGFNHTIIGAMVAQKWNFPEDTCLAILKHHDLLPAVLESIEERRSAIVQCANLLAHQRGFGNFGRYPDRDAELLGLLVALGVEPLGLDPAMDEIASAASDQRSAL